MIPHVPTHVFEIYDADVTILVHQNVVDVKVTVTANENLAIRLYRLRLYSQKTVYDTKGVANVSFHKSDGRLSDLFVFRKKVLCLSIPPQLRLMVLIP